MCIAAMDSDVCFDHVACCAMNTCFLDVSGTSSDLNSYHLGLTSSFGSKAAALPTIVASSPWDVR